MKDFIPIVRPSYPSKLEKKVKKGETASKVWLLDYDFYHNFIKIVLVK